MFNENIEKPKIPRIPIELIPELSPDDVELIDDDTENIPELNPDDVELQELKELKIASYSEASKKHPDTNEDAFFMDTNAGIAGVFDGLGGYGHGEIASKIAREIIEVEMSEIPENIKLEDLKKLMFNILKKASNDILEQSKDKNFNQIGTTATVIKFWEGANGKRKAIIANVGDSRAYRLRDGKLEAITEDDSIMKRLIEGGVVKDDNPKQIIKGQDVINTGLLSVDDAKTLDPNMNISIENIRRMMGQALGVHENNNKNLKPNITTVDIDDGDILLLSSDGIHDNLEDSKLELLLNSGKNEQELSKSIVESASKVALDKNNPRAKEDDKTAIIIKI